MGDRVAVMRKGELQQMDAPQKLYDAPANLFVASFIGSPSMNLFEATVQRRANGLARAGSATRSCRCPTSVARRRPALAGYAGRTSGARHPSRAPRGRGLARNGGARLRGRVLLTEALGSEILAHVEVKATPVVTDDVVEGAVVDAEEHVARGRLARQPPTATRRRSSGRFDPSSRVRPDERRRVRRRHGQAAVLRPRDRVTRISETAVQQ